MIIDTTFSVIEKKMQNIGKYLVPENPNREKFLPNTWTASNSVCYSFEDSSFEGGVNNFNITESNRKITWT